MVNTEEKYCKSVVSNEEKWARYIIAEGADVNLVSKFLSYHDKHPKIYEAFKKFSFEAKEAGLEKFSCWFIANRIRWFYQVENREDRVYKITNDYIACYARQLMFDFPELDGFFTTKKMKRIRTKVVE